jgi:hypothetical protein
MTKGQGMLPLQTWKTGIVSIGRDPFRATLDGERGRHIRSVEAS